MKKKVRGNSRYVTYMVTGILLLIIIFNFGRSYLRKWDKCLLKTVVIKNNAAISEEKLQSIMSTYIGQNLFTINKREIKDKILEFYRIKEVKISRRLFDKLIITVYEHNGYVNVLTKDNKIFTLNSDVVVLNEFSYNKNDDYPLIRTSLHSRNCTPGVAVTDAAILEIIEYHKKLLEVKPEIQNYISEYYKEGNDICFREIKSGKKVIIDLRYLEENISMFFSMLESLRYDEYSTYIFKFKDKTIRK